MLLGAGPREAFYASHPEKYRKVHGTWVEHTAYNGIRPAAKFDTLNTVALQREAQKIGAERLKAYAEFDRTHRPQNTISSGVQIGTQRQDQFQHPAPVIGPVPATVVQPSYPAPK